MQAARVSVLNASLNFAINELTDVIMGIEEMKEAEDVSDEMLAKMTTHVNKCRDELFVLQLLIQKAEQEKQ